MIFFFFWFVGFCLGYWRFRSVLCFCCCCCSRYSWRGRRKARERKKNLFYPTRSEQLLPQTGELLFIRFGNLPSICCSCVFAVFPYIVGFFLERRAYYECSKAITLGVSNLLAFKMTKSQRHDWMTWYENILKSSKWHIFRGEWYFHTKINWKD